MLGENPRFLKILGRIVFRLERNPQLREDLIQEALLHATRLELLRPEATMNWVSKAANSICRISSDASAMLSGGCSRSLLCRNPMQAIRKRTSQPEKWFQTSPPMNH